MNATASTGIAWRKVTVTFDGHMITIHRAGLGTSEDKIPIAKITNVDFEAPFAKAGRIEFGVSQRHQVVVHFSPWKAGEFAQLRQAVEAAL